MTTLLPLAVMWHYVRTGTARPQVRYGGVSPTVFAEELDAICAAFEPIGWPVLDAAVRAGHSLPDDAIVLTFDDGLVDHHEAVLPELARRSLPAICFVLARQRGEPLTLGHRLHVLLGIRTAESVRSAVLERMARDDVRRYLQAVAATGRTDPTDPDDAWKRPFQRELAGTAGPILSALVEEALGPEGDVADSLYLSPTQLDDLVAAGMTLGGHGRAHAWLDAIGREDRRQEIDASRAFLARRGPGPWPFAYPYGGVPPDAARLLEVAGFSAAFTTDPDERSDRYRIGRIDGDDVDRVRALAGIPLR